MGATQRWQVGETIVLREVLAGHIRSVRPLRVIEDRPGLVAGYLVPDSTVGWPRLLDGLQSQTPDQGWVLREERWFGPGSLYVFCDGEPWAAVLFRDRETLEPLGWKIDLMDPPRRFGAGLDTLDHSLDLMAEPDGSNCEPKDTDDLAQLARMAVLGPDGAARVPAAADRVRAMIADGEGPFDGTWLRWQPDRAWPALTLPDGWDDVTGLTSAPVAELVGERAAAVLGPAVPSGRPVARSGRGARLLEADGRELVDLDLASGAVACGHAHPRIVEAVRRQADLVTATSLLHEGTVRLAELLVDRFGGGRVRFTRSGHAALAVAVAAARAGSGREPVVVRPCASPGELEALRRQAADARDTGGLIVADERRGLVTGAHGFAASVGIDADLVVLGESMANGAPLAAVVGPAELLDGGFVDGGAPGGAPVELVPDLPDAVTVVAALETLRVLDDHRDATAARAARLRNALGVDGYSSLLWLGGLDRVDLAERGVLVSSDGWGALAVREDDADAASADAAVEVAVGAAIAAAMAGS
ncbi:MAG: aminotransferase class III-fold pyridoxal phosphate-dependent enzyme [Actinomycetota bacterium]|nr:aminotransferase class III-fold pyridoxal phosphate-dependent enzyme [Actinomycetota bacterium]